MIDKAAWKTNDPEWVKKREAQWNGGLEKYLQERVSHLEDADPREYMKNARKFFDGVEIAYPVDYLESLSTPYWHIRVAMHPHPAVGVIRTIYDDWDSKQPGRSTPSYGVSYRVIQTEWAKLLKAGVLDESIVDNFMEAMYGNSYEEACRLRNINPNEALESVLHNLLADVCSWLCNLNSVDPDFFPHKQLLVQIIDMFKLVDDVQFKNLAYKVKRFFRYLTDFEKLETASSPRRQAFVAECRKAMQEHRNEFNPKFWPYIDAGKVNQS